MVAKDYLNQLKLLDTKIKLKQEQYRELKSLAYNAPALKYDDVKVLSSRQDNYSNVDRYMDMEKDIGSSINDYIELKNEIIEEIQQLDNPLYIELLYKRYVQFKGFEEIADEMGYCYRHITRLHGKALKCFDELMGTR